MKEHATKCKTNDRIMIGGGNLIPRKCDCDGYHTFDELYDHRITLYIALCFQIKQQPYGDKKHKVWRSKRHSDGELCFGTGTQFVLGIGTEAGNQITYHVPIERWHETDGITEYVEAPSPWDGHTSDDVLTRLKAL